MTPGAKLEKGSVVGILSPEAHSFTWNINKSVPTEGPKLDQNESLVK
jgi:hypothetical protein